MISKQWTAMQDKSRPDAGYNVEAVEMFWFVRKITISIVR